MGKLGEYMSDQFKSIAIAKEIIGPENPDGSERRVAMIPDDVKRLVVSGFDVYVEYGAGEGVEFSDDAYLRAGAKLQTAPDIFQSKDLVICLKGLNDDAVAHMVPGTTVLSLAYVDSFPERLKVYERNQVNLIAMEDILESPKVQNDDEILGRLAMSGALQAYLESNQIGALQVMVVGWSPVLGAAARRASNRGARSVSLISEKAAFEAFDLVGDNVLYFYDSAHFDDAYGHLERVASMGTHVVDVRAFERFKVQELIKEYRQSHPPFEFGMRRIECLHETGVAGARYGLKLLAENKPDLSSSKAKVVVLGYGNVAQGAMDACLAAGVERVAVLGPAHTAKGRIDYWLKDADLIINGADQEAALRGVNYLVTEDHMKNLIPKASVIVDLVGGRPTKRSPIEAVIQSTPLSEPSFMAEGIAVAAINGWPRMGLMRESTMKYSGQILDVLMGPEKLLEGIAHLSPGVERALKAGPFSKGKVH